MAADDRDAFRLALLNPGGRDPEQDFSESSSPAAADHPPVNFHAYAACTGGSFHCETKAAMARKRPVLLLLRGDFKASERALRELKKGGASVVLSLKETGLHQIANQLGDSARLGRFLRVMAEADGCLAPTPEAADFYRTVRPAAAAIAFIPTPYPLHDPRWDFSRPIEERRGIFIGTREWDVPSRNHLAALLAARQISDDTGEPVSVFNCDGRKGQRLLSELGLKQLAVIERGEGYADYLREVARHKIVFQLDTSFVPGQVAGDALLCRMPCVGGNGAIEQIAFPELCGAGRPISELIEIAKGLLQDATFYRNVIAASQQRAIERLSFEFGAAELQGFLRRIAAKGSCCRVL